MVAPAMSVLRRMAHCSRVLFHPVTNGRGRALHNNDSISGDGTSSDGNQRGADFTRRSPYAEEIERREADVIDKLCRDFRTDYARVLRKKGELIPNQTDILIIGGGVVGSSIAYWLKRRAPKSFSVLVVERDPTYQRCATTRSAGGIRQQFSLKENCQMALFGAEFLRDYKYYLGEDAPDPHFQPEGYLTLADTEEKAVLMEKNAKLQRECGTRIELLTKETIKSRFPYIRNDDVELASYGLQNEGWFDPWALLQGLKQFNLRQQTGYLNAELVDFRFRSLKNLEAPQTYEPTNHAIVRLPNGEIQEITFALLILAAGPQTGDVGRLLRIGTGSNVLGVPIPVEPRKKAIYTFHAPEAPIVGFPFLIDPTGVYCRREGLGGQFICGQGLCNEEDPCNDMDLDTIDEAYFKEVGIAKGGAKVIWPTLAKRAPVFEKVKLGRSWAGFYDYNYLDEHAIIGWHPYYHNCLICSGFSGHGLQMAIAAGRSIMEMLIDGEFVSIDLERFSFTRVITGETIYERDVV
ncbi:FAD-dependent oxidoreductase domain-containing protein 1-like [Tropilaelaps mercedesae]|uniref:FAD-dependent oxidoreductase domain-containing protein 1 n=1 Tax=Tropilaelaps mercedesae TaxID=418985 RepID=A0A1V9XJT6_9ACAR|nr:FAD-dependent oxidoreductase domain-containing protein 1-like [Tropilaelaps mercedesae]